MEGAHGPCAVALRYPLGSVSREEAAQTFALLSARFRGRRAAIKELTHRDPDFVFWIFPDGGLYNARDSHHSDVPRGYEHIVNDAPDYDGVLRGRVTYAGEHQLVVVYCLALTCTDGVQSQGEAGIDCGKPCDTEC